MTTAGEALAFGGEQQTSFERRGDLIAGLLAELRECGEDYARIVQEESLILTRRVEALRRGRALWASVIELGGELPEGLALPADFKPLRTPPRRDPVLIQRDWEKSKEGCPVGHREIRYNQQTRTVWCATCKVELDPILALDDVAMRLRGEADELAAKKKVLEEYARHEAEKAWRYNQRHRKRHPQSVNKALDGSGTQIFCSACLQCDDNAKQFGQSWQELGLTEAPRTSPLGQTA